MSNNGKISENQYKNSCNDNNCMNPLAAWFFSLPPKKFSLLSSILGILFLNNLDLDQQNSLGNFIVNIGTNILTSAAQGQLQQSTNSQNDRIRQQILLLRQQLNALEKELDNKN
ncbi:MAG: hypothetical protein PHV32_02505 [Eubacteriales bacterium]|nr:hypothetical protein [Eubacteriales bacterium]